MKIKKSCNVFNFCFKFLLNPCYYSNYVYIIPID